MRPMMMVIAERRDGVGAFVLGSSAQELVVQVYSTVTRCVQVEPVSVSGALILVADTDGVGHIGWHRTTPRRLRFDS